MPDTAVQVDANIRKLREDLTTAVGRLENLYRLIYGYNTLKEPVTNNHEYIAERYMIDTLKLLADENGWTGRKCKVCEGTGDIYSLNCNNESVAEPCNCCAGTGSEWISPTA